LDSDGKSKYDRIRDANIAQNKKLLFDLGLLSSLDDETDKRTKKKGKKGKKGRKDVHTMSRSLDIAR
jgi:hypothetical protein